MHYLDPIDIGDPAVAQFFDELPLWSAPFGRMLLERVPLPRKGTILDVGAGTGFLSLELAQRCGPNTMVIAADPWKHATDQLRHRLAYLRIENVLVMEHDAGSLDLLAGSVDLIVSNLGVNNFENADAVLRHCHGLAAPDAPLILTTNLVGHMQEFYDVYRKVLEPVSSASQLKAFDAHVEHRGTIESVSALLEGAGFEVEHSTNDSFRMRFVDGSALLRHYFIRLGFLADWVKLAPAGQIEETFVELEMRLNAVAKKRGELSLTIPMACIESRRGKD